MAALNVDQLTAALEQTKVSPSGVTFAGKSLKLNSEEDAKEVIEAIDRCGHLEYLNLEGNTLGVEASKGIAKALEKRGEFKRALWKDMFTGRMKEEIPKALEFLGNGLVAAGARLTELDLSDNAFGPIGVEGLASLLRSSSCYALEELRLNNNGLGIGGGKLLASALTDCYNCSKKGGVKPLSLRVFIAGRNRLENEGAKALAGVFKMIGTLEEIAMPQNGIYHEGISALSDAFTHNKNLQIVNLNDNTVSQRGAGALAKALPNLQNLKEINLGDCLIRSEGAVLLADALKDGHVNLEQIMLNHNEISKEGGVEIVKAIANKTKLKSLNLDGNQFGTKGRDEIKDELKKVGKINTLGSLSEDESEDSDQLEDDDEEAHDEQSESETEVVEIQIKGMTVGDFLTKHSDRQESKVVDVDEFLKNPTAENFAALGDAKDKLLLSKVKSNNDQIDADKFVSCLMKVCSLTSDIKVAKSALECAEKLCQELFAWSQKSDNSSIVNNMVVTNLGLIKSEDKKFKPPWNLEACRNAFKIIIEKPFVPQLTKDTFQMFLAKINT